MAPKGITVADGYNEEFKSRENGPQFVQPTSTPGDGPHPITSVSDDTITLHYDGETSNSNHADTNLFDEYIIEPTSSTGKYAEVNTKVCKSMPK